MPDYPFKIRMRMVRGSVEISKMVPSAGGSYYAKDKVWIQGAALVDAMLDPAVLDSLELPTRTPRPV